MKEDFIASGRRKVVVVGAGAVGSTYCYALAQSGLADEIVIIDKNQELANGQVSDLVHGQPFFPTAGIRMGDQSDYTNANLIVITAGAAMKPGESRLDLLKKNTLIVGEIAGEIAARKSTGVMLIVSNPVDVLTYVALKKSGWEKGRVIGSGTVLDSARFRHFLSRYCGVDVHNVHAYILGEHGDSEFAAWSMTHIAGIPIEDYCRACNGCTDSIEERNKIERQVRESAYHIINAKGSTHFAVGLALVRITESILRKQNSVLTVSTYIDGEFGLEDICLSVPCIVSHTGIVKIISRQLPERERILLLHSASVLKEAIASLRSP